MPTGVIWWQVDSDNGGHLVTTWFQNRTSWLDLVSTVMMDTIVGKYLMSIVPTTVSEDRHHCKGKTSAATCCNLLLNETGWNRLILSYRFLTPVCWLISILLPNEVWWCTILWPLGSKKIQGRFRDHVEDAVWSDANGTLMIVASHDLLNIPSNLVCYQWDSDDEHLLASLEFLVLEGSVRRLSLVCYQMKSDDIPYLVQQWYQSSLFPYFPTGKTFSCQKLRLTPIWCQQLEVLVLRELWWKASWF